MSKQNLDWEKQEKKEKANYSNELNCHSTGKSIKRKQQNQSKGNNSLYDINVYIYILVGCYIKKR